MITKAAIVNGFQINGQVRYDVFAVIAGELPADKLNEEAGQFEIVSEDFNFLDEWECSLIGIEFGDNDDNDSESDDEGSESEEDSEEDSE